MAKFQFFPFKTALPVLVVLSVASLTGWSQSPEETTSGAGTAMASSYATAVQSPGGGVARAATPVESTAEIEGDTLMGHQRYQAAIEAYKNAPQDSATVWNKMGIAYQLLFNNAEALRCYETARQLEPKNSSVINNLGSLAISARRFGEAEKLYRKAVKLDPHSPLFHKNLGTAYISDRKYKKGWEEYRAALELDPNVFSHASGVRVSNPTSAEERGAMNYYMARGCMLAGEKQQAIEYLRLALNEGYITAKKIYADEDFAALHDMPAFHDLMKSESQDTSVR
jgi:tetratricopeptide (TPR) repeat protein